MTALGGFLNLGGFVACCGLLFVLFLCALVVWYWKHQPEQEVSAPASEPPVQAATEHPTVATPVAPAAQAPVQPAPPSDYMPPSADA
jgi:hypothetical protein